MSERFLLGRSTDILHLEAGEGILLDRIGTTLRVRRDDSQLAFGSMFIYALGTGSVTVPVAATDVFYQVGSGASFGVLYRVLFQNARELKVQIPGTYHVDWHMSIECASANQEVEGALMLDGVAFTPLGSHGEIATASRPVALGSTGLIALGVDSLVSLAVLNHTTVHDLIVDHLNLAIERVGN